MSSAIESLVTLVNMDDYRRRLGAEAKQYAAGFTWEAVIERFVSLYYKVLQERRAKSSRG
jgi:glycosyltransferase involved in cell wall biosynthesis